MTSSRKSRFSSQKRYEVKSWKDSRRVLLAMISWRPGGSFGEAIVVRRRRRRRKARDGDTTLRGGRIKTEKRSRGKKTPKGLKS